MATLKEIIEYSKKNPNTEYAKKAYEHIKSGAFDAQAATEGVDLSFAGRPAPEPKKSLGVRVAEGIGNFTGGTKIAQGLGQAMAAGGTNEALDQADAESMRIQGDLIKHIKDKKAAGGDTTKLEEALKHLTHDLQNSGNNREKVLNPNNLTNKEVIGDAIQLGTTAAGAKVGSAIASKIPGAGVGVLKGAAVGAAKGAASAGTVGVAEGVAQGFKANKSAGGIIKSGLAGGAIGAATGGIIGGVAGGIAGAKKAKALGDVSNSKELKALQSTEKTMTKLQKEAAVDEGRYEATKLGGKKILPSDTETRAAAILKGKLKSNPVENVSVIKKEIATRGREAEKFLEDNVQKISADEQSTIFSTFRDKAEKSMTETELKAYDEQMKLFLKQIPGRGGYDTSTFYKGLKDYESNVASKLARGKEALLDPTGIASAKINAASDIRKVVRDMIAGKHPEFSEKMFDLASLYDVKDTVLTKAVKLSGNVITRFAKKHPYVTGAVVGEGGRKLFTGHY